MKHPTFDKDGYPTRETIDEIVNWPIKRGSDVKDLLDYVGEAWTYQVPVSTRPHDSFPGRTIIKVATGGWSGNEALISALQENRMFWALAWVSSSRGGAYEFEIRE